MTEQESPESESRRKFMKGAAATGLTAAGVGMFSGSAAAQNVTRLQLRDVQVADGLLTIQVQNVRVIRDVNIQDNVVTIIGDDLTVDVLNNVTVNINDSLIEVSNVDVDILNDSVVQVAVGILGDAGNLAFGSTFDEL